MGLCVQYLQASLLHITMCVYFKHNCVYRYGVYTDCNVERHLHAQTHSKNTWLVLVLAYNVERKARHCKMGGTEKKRYDGNFNMLTWIFAREYTENTDVWAIRLAEADVDDVGKRFWKIRTYFTDYSRHLRTWSYEIDYLRKFSETHFRMLYSVKLYLNCKLVKSTNVTFVSTPPANY